MGTPAFSVPSLRALVQAGHTIAAVYTQPDQPAGRGRELKPSAVKQEAILQGIPVEEVDTLRTDESVARLASYKPDVIVVAAFSHILPTRVLELPSRGCLNIHPSLLPLHRGPSPIAASLLAGDKETGVTIMLMDEGLDTGPVLAQDRVEIAEEDTTGSLTGRLGTLGAGLLVDTIAGWILGEIAARRQDDSMATYSEKIVAADGVLEWREPAEVLWRRIRAYNPWPGCYTMWGEKRLKVHAATVAEGEASTAVGRVVPLGGGRQGVGVVTGRGILKLETVQLEGKRPVAAGEFIRGQSDFVNSILIS
ncbi:MAG: methionyl-tRNA formyltransferase [Dehalococcoidia bacterium]|nr:methionyl-tRNA formyltransferase [Dehalococcoidia bacterium]